MKSSGRPAGKGASVAGGGGVGGLHLGKKQRNTLKFTSESIVVRSTLLRRRRWLIFPDTAETERCQMKGDIDDLSGK